METLVSDIRAGEGTIADLFYSVCGVPGGEGTVESWRSVHRNFECQLIHIKSLHKYLHTIRKQYRKGGMGHQRVPPTPSLKYKGQEKRTTDYLILQKL